MSAAQSPSSPFGRIGQVVQVRKQPQASRVVKKTSTPVLLLSSAIAGGVEALATYPFEYAKTLVQLQPSPKPHHNPFAVLATVARNNGLASIYTGCSTLVLGTAFKVSIRFLSFTHYRAHLTSPNGVLTPLNGILAGALAGLTESIVAVTPTERLKTLLIDHARRQTTLYRGEQGWGAVVRSQTVRSLYRGLVPTVLKQSSTQGVKMGAYNVIREYGRRQQLPQNAATAFVAGALAGVVTVYVTQPFDTVKTWAQSARGAGTVDAVRMVVRGTGVRGLWRGSTSRVGRLAFSSSILYTVYEKVGGALSGSLEKEVFAFTPIPSAGC